MELEALMGAVVEVGEKVGVPTPATRMLYACAKLLEAQPSSPPDSPRLLSLWKRTW